MLYSFDGVGDDGASPEGPLLFDDSGNIYGTTAFGGDENCQGGFGCGVVFELSRSGSTWVYTTLYAFQGGEDGSYPACDMVFDNEGSLYGTTKQGGGGTGYSGIAFRLSPAHGTGSGGWTETVLHRFVNFVDSGPNDGVTMGKWGSFTVLPGEVTLWMEGENSSSNAKSATRPNRLRS